MACAFDRLSSVGTRVDVPLQSLLDWEAEHGRPLPSSVRELVATRGAGWLLGLYEVPSPASGAWTRWNERAAKLRRRGCWAGLDADAWSRLFVFAVDRRGNALAVVTRARAERFYLLLATGGVVELGRSPEELLDLLVARAAWTFDTDVPDWRPPQGGPVDRGRAMDLGIEACWVAGADASRAWLRLLEAGGDADEALTAALSSEPVLLAYVHLIALLCGPEADTVPAERRADALDTVLALARRREPALSRLVFPPELTDGSTWSHPSVRAWASRPTRFDGPTLALPDEAPDVEPLEDDLRPPMIAPAVDAERELRGWRQAWSRADEAPAMDALLGECLSAPAPVRFALVRQLVATQDTTFLPGHRWPRLGPPTYDGGVRERIKEAVARLLARREHAWPFVALALGFVGRLACDLLPVFDGVADLRLRPPLLLVIERGGGASCDGDFARAFLSRFKADADLVDRLLPVLGGSGGPLVPRDPVMVLASRISEDNRVYEAFLERYDAQPYVIAPALVKRPTERTRRFLKARMKDGDICAAEALAQLGDDAAKRMVERYQRQLGRI